MKQISITNLEFSRIKGLLISLREVEFDSDSELESRFSYLYEKLYEIPYNSDLFNYVLCDMRKPSQNDVENKQKLDLLYSKLIEYSSDLQHCGLNDMLKPPSTEFKNESPLDFIDINSEEYRIYEFNNGKTIMISEPLKLNVSKSGGHRIYDNAGMSHYIPQGWVRVSWKAKAGQPNFVK